VARLIFSGLIQFDSRGIPQPDLANWGVSEDGTLVNVSLRPKLRWHDGKPLTTDDVIFTIDLIKNGGNVVSKDLQEFWKGVEVVRLNDSNLQFRLPEAYAPFLDYLTFGVLPKHLLGGKSAEQMIDDPYNLQPVGSGPYKFSRLLVENEQITGVVLAVNPDYYLDKPYIDEVVFRYYPDDASVYKAYRDGQVQGIGQVGADILNDVLGEPNLAVYTARQPVLTLVLFNLNNPDVAFLQDKNIRRALLEGINRQGIVDKILQGQGVLADGVILPGTWAYYDGLPPVNYDPEDAKGLLKTAGFAFASENDTTLSKGGASLKFTLLTPDTPAYQAVAGEIQANWRNLGVEVDLEALPYDQLVEERLVGRSYQAALVDLNFSRYPDPDPYPFWDQAQSSGEGQNYSMWDNRMASEYLEQARITKDLGQRARLYRNFQVVFSSELPALPLYYSVYTYAVDKEIQGVRIGPFFEPDDRFTGIAGWFLAGRPKGGSQPEVTNTP
jgi:peptide/nickel transport system substrate-binding protein